ncbi:MAG: DNA mismatch repair protein [Candidatus Magasanikbacteria bacterium]|nr:DNA mismatch repair protein [Candidatus Magasanikbacteria bacterium]
MTTRTPEEILDQPKVSLVEVYLQLQQHYEGVFGENAIIIMEVGSFYEVYGVDNAEMKIGKPKEIAEVLNIQLTRRNKRDLQNSMKNPLLAGFPTATFDRYIGRLTAENRYTIIIVRQKGAPPNVERYIDRVLSPGVNFDYRPGHDEQTMASVLVEMSGNMYNAAYSAIDVATGKSYVFEAHSTGEDHTAALDAIFHLLQSRGTGEVVLTCSPDIAPFVTDYLELQNIGSLTTQEKRLDVAFQNTLLGSTYNIESYLSAVETLDLEKTPLASEALALVIDWIIQHERPLAERLHRPMLLRNNAFLYLGNDPLHQLAMLSHDPHEQTILKLMNHTRTSIGRRLLKDRLLHPITNPEEMTARYDLADAVAPLITEIEIHLREVYDIERLARRLRLGRLHPFEVNFLFDSLEAAINIITTLESQDLPAIKQLQDHKETIQTCIKEVKAHFSLSETGQVTNQAISRSLFKQGFDKELDAMLAQKEAEEAKLELIKEKMVELLLDATGKDESNFVVIKQMDKDGHYISLTKSRYAQIQEALSDTYVSIDETVYAFSDFRFKVQVGNVKITAGIIDDVSGSIVSLQTKIIGRVRELFAQELVSLDTTFGDTIHMVSGLLAAIDVAVSTAKAAQTLRLVRPELTASKNHENYLEIADLRHPLVEAREENGIYITNNVLLGSAEYTNDNTLPMLPEADDVRGLLLYGINASGKSSFMKAIGIAVMLAQAGFFVPATRMRFSPFEELFTRILAKDNVERGLSSFAVEMMELKNIFTRCSPKSLILGDEICRGTETLSAIAIVSAAVKRLSEKGSLFLFTTHLHQLANLDVFSSLPHVVCGHLAVRYDEAQDLLIFDRTLQQGSGSSIYGLEFAQSLHMDETFLKDAMNIRKHLADDFDELELLTKKVKSAYNKDLFLSSCSLCHNKAEETHHISPQEIADKHGNIGHFHKNHKANLITLCDDCHDNIHHGKIKVKGYVMTSKGLQLDVEEMEQES